MTLKSLIAAGLALAFVAAQDPADDPKGDPVPENLLGSYEIVSGEHEGTAVPADRIEGSRVRITAESIVTTGSDGKDIYVAKFNLATGSTPWKIAMTATGTPEGGRGEEADGIIEVDGDTVRIAYAPEGGVTPTEFKTVADSGQNLFVLERVEE